MRRTDWNVSVVDIHLQKLLWCAALDRAKQPSQVACFLEDIKCWGAWNLQAQSSGHHTIDHLEERGMERGSARQSSLKGQERAIINQTIKSSMKPWNHDKHWNHFKGNVGETSDRWGGAHVGFSKHIDTILNWSELKSDQDHVPASWSPVSWAAVLLCQHQFTEVIPYSDRRGRMCISGVGFCPLNTLCIVTVICSKRTKWKGQGRTLKAYTLYSKLHTENKNCSGKKKLCRLQLGNLCFLLKQKKGFFAGENIYKNWGGEGGGSSVFKCHFR